MTGHVIVTIIGAFLLILCIYPICLEIFNIGTVTGIVTGILLICFGVFPGRMRHAFGCLPHPARVFLTVLVIAAAVSAVVISISMAIACSRMPGQADTLIVLGCQVRGEKPCLSLQERIDAAAVYLKTHPAAKAVLSGGQGSDEKITEAECIRRGLVKAGVDGSRLYPEDRSTTTVENLSFSGRIIEENGLNPNIALCTNEYHILRSGMIARKLGYTVSAVPAHTAFRIFFPAYLRELFAVLAQLVGIPRVSRR